MSRPRFDAEERGQYLVLSRSSRELSYAISFFEYFALNPQIVHMQYSKNIKRVK